VQVVDGLNAIHRHHHLLYVPHTDMAGRTLEKNVHRPPEQVPGSREDKQPDSGGEEWIGVRPARRQEDQPCRNRSNRPEYVTKDLHERAADVQRLPGAGHQEARADQVDAEADGGDNNSGMLGTSGGSLSRSAAS